VKGTISAFISRMRKLTNALRATNVLTTIPPGYQQVQVWSIKVITTCSVSNIRCNIDQNVRYFNALF